MAVVGKLGKLDPKFPAEIQLIEHYLRRRKTLPKAPESVDNTRGRTDFGMLGNGPDPSCDVAPQGVRDCGCAGFVHLEEVDAAVLAVKETWPSADLVVQQYLAYTGGQDSGVVLADFLDFVQQHSFCGMTVAGYAPCRHDDLDEVKSVIDLFDAAYVGVQLPRVALDQFESEQPWDLTGTEADDDIAGGHAIVAAAFDPETMSFITWGKVQTATTRWVHRYIDEAWAVLTDEFAAAKPKTIDYPALLADLAKMRNAA